MDEAQFDQALDQYHRAAGEFVKGNPESYKAAFSHRDDVTLGNPFGPFARGWDDRSRPRWIAPRPTIAMER